MQEKRRPSLVEEGHRMVVLIPTELLTRLRKLAADRAVHERGQISVGAVVRDLLEEAIADDDPKGRGNKRKTKGNNAWIRDAARELPAASPTPVTSHLRHAA